VAHSSLQPSIITKFHIYNLGFLLLLLLLLLLRRHSLYCFNSMTLLRVTSTPTASSPPPSTISPLSLKKVWRYFNRSFHSSSSKHSTSQAFHTISTSTVCPPLSSQSPINLRGHSSLAWSKKSSSDNLSLTVAPVDRTSRIDEGFYQIVKPSHHDKAEPTVGL
jgi:hypothetical protein